MFNIDLYILQQLTKHNKNNEGNLFFPDPDELSRGSKEQILINREIKREFLKDILLQIKPNTVLETGTNCGCFCYFVKTFLPEVKIFTFGIDKFSDNCVKYLNNIFGSYITFIEGDTKDTLPKFQNKNIDMAWIDGGHDVNTCLSDLNQCVRLNIEHILVDDVKSIMGVIDAVNIFLQRNVNYKLKEASIDNSGVAYIIKK